MRPRFRDICALWLMISLDGLDAVMITASHPTALSCRARINLLDTMAWIHRINSKRARQVHFALVEIKTDDVASVG